jgi:hypothetical protein
MLVPELHDIGKLIDKEATGVEHNFENYPIQLSSDTWKGITEHHCSPNFKKYPTNPDTFKLCIADNMASAVSRYAVERRGLVFNVYKLWNPCHESLTQSFIRSEEEIKQLLSFITKEPSANKFFTKYGDMLRKRTEDAALGKNVTSLYTHSKLTGQFFRILISDNRRFDIEPEKLKDLSREEVSNLIKRKQNEWKMSIIRCKINFVQTPVRARDMNVFKIREKLIDEIKNEMCDNIFFSTTDELLLFTPNGQDALDKIKKKVQEFGFWLDTVMVESQIASLEPKLVGMRKNGHIAVYPPLFDKIAPPICELCQMAKAKEQPWIDEESGIREFLCEKCWKIREAGSLLTRFVEWEMSEQNSKICWVKIWLDYDTLVKNLAELYRLYLKETRSLTQRSVEIRFSTISEFQWDYDGFLMSFLQEITKNFGPEDVQEILVDFLAVKIDSLSQIKSILDRFISVYDRFFPRFREVGSPIKLSIVGSNIKFPFSENWRLLCDLKDEVNVHLIGKGSIQLKIRDLRRFLKTRIDKKALLHKLVRISEMSPKLAKITLNDRADRDFKRFENFRNAVETFGFQNILTYVKMMSDCNETS